MSKLNSLFKSWPNGTVAVQSWLEAQGVYRQLTKRYLTGGWVEKLGPGAFKKVGDRVDWLGGIYAMQQELKLPIHVGGRTALELQGKAHFIPLGSGGPLYIYSTAMKDRHQLPKWFAAMVKPYTVEHIRKNYFTKTLGVEEVNVNNFTTRVASSERAILEVIALVPKLITYHHAYYLMQGLELLRPHLLQELLVHCSSMRLKRLFLHLAYKCNLLFVQDLDLSALQLGTSKIVIGKGEEDLRFNIQVPAMPYENDNPEF